ncbi:glycosyltransferase family 4 protein [Rhizobium sp. FKY42]|uniref:glycosyltransferase family 4 protein n=1 Tax=Rhizobium sp. FKY42 TaxID=2562310 RepID=UPI0010C10928|nr:glycosyltransferase family 4 protein [Rhizobium sp. FKY42]
MVKAPGRFALIVASFDGLVSVRTGVGIVVSAFFEEYKYIVDLLQIDNRDLDLYALSPFLQHGASEFDASTFNATRMVCEQNGGAVIEFPSFSKGENRSKIWAPKQKGTSGALQWRSMALASAACVETIATRYDRVLVIHHDTILSQLPRYIHSGNVKTIWVPHSLASVFNNDWAITTIPFERKAVEHLRSGKNSVGYISGQFRDALQSMLESNAMSRNAITLHPLSNNFAKITFPRFSEENVRKILQRYHIPLDRPLVFSWARCVEQKGWDLLLPEIEKVIQTAYKDFHFVLVVAFKPETTDYQTQINTFLYRLEAHPNITVLREFDDLLPKVILNHRGLDTVILPSRAEGMSLAGLEIRNQNRSDIKVICSDIYSFRETFTDCPNAHFFDPTLKGSLFHALITAAKSNTNEYSVTTSDRAYLSYATAISLELEL